MPELAQHGGDLAAMVSPMVDDMQNHLINRLGIRLAFQVFEFDHAPAILLLGGPLRKAAQQRPPVGVKVVD